MAYDTVISWLGVMTIIFAFLFFWVQIYQDYVIFSNTQFQEEQKQLQEIRGQMQVASISYSNQSLNVSVKNTGSERIFLKDKNRDMCFELYVDGNWASDWEYEFTKDPFHPGLWDPEEIILLKMNKSLSSGNHTVQMISCNSVSTGQDFNVS